MPPWGEQSVGEECTRPTGVVGLDTCAPGGYCANFGNPSPIDRTCRAVCNVNDDCSQDENCLNISTQSPRSGVCLASCVPFSDDCTGANHCTWGYDTDLKIILYCDFFGNVGLGGNCSTAKCAEGLLCAAKATGYQCVNACDQDHPCLGDSSCYPFIESAPFSGVCHETDWTCIGGAPWEAPVAPNMTVEFSVMDYVLGTPSANASVKICESTDENCATPLESITTDANGLASLTIPVGAAGFDGFFEVSAPNRVTVLRKFNRPLTAEMIEVQNFGIADQAAYQSTYAPSGFTIDFARGHVEAQILDCLGYSAFGVEFQATGIDANSEIAYLDRLYATDDSLTETSIAGFGLVLNVPGTSTTVTATRASDSMNLATLMVPIRPGCFTEVRLVPEP